ncbi:hypothetical protein HMI54_001355 [Coelomomyces lativittatus]|nr:hypothetical protein HMI54_001355 [Coelomomyces lativittatus]
MIHNKSKKKKKKEKTEKEKKKKETREDKEKGEGIRNRENLLKGVLFFKQPPTCPLFFSLSLYVSYSIFYFCFTFYLLLSKEEHHSVIYTRAIHTHPTLKEISPSNQNTLYSLSPH